MPENHERRTQHALPPIEETTFFPGRQGFFIDYPNGFRLSVMYGCGNYADNHGARHDTPHHELNGTESVEIAVIDYTKEGQPFVGLPQDVAGRVPVERLHSIINGVRCADFRLICQECDQNYHMENDPTLDPMDIKAAKEKMSVWED